MSADAFAEEPGPDDPGDAFTLQEQLVIELVAAGFSHESAGASVQRSAKYAQRLLRRPEARRRVQELQAERLEQVVGELGVAVVEAAQVIRSELQGEGSSSRLKAAALALRGYSDLRAAAHQKAIIEALHGQIAELTTAIEHLEGGGRE